MWRQEDAFGKGSDKIMKTITTAMLGLSLTLGSAALSLAAQNDKMAPATTDTKTTTKVKKHHKRAKKSVAPATDSAAKPAPAPTK